MPRYAQDGHLADSNWLVFNFSMAAVYIFVVLVMSPLCFSPGSAFWSLPCPKRSCVPECHFTSGFRLQQASAHAQGLCDIKTWFAHLQLHGAPIGCTGAIWPLSTAQARRGGGGDVIWVDSLNSCQPLSAWELLRAVNDSFFQAQDHTGQGKP